MDQINQIFLSNQTEQLYEELKRALFASTNPFIKRIVIVPSVAMKSWLMLRMARDPELGISAGLQIGFVDPMLQQLIHLLGKPQKGRNGQRLYSPSQLELSFGIENVIAGAVGEASLGKAGCDREWAPLLDYIGAARNGQAGVSKKARRRMTRLSGFLAEQFRKYELYGGRMLASWKKRKEGGWQQLLWERLEGLFDRWGYVSRQIEEFAPRDDLPSDGVQIHLFGMSYLPPAYYRFFNKLAPYVPVNYFLLSPCGKFWGDILSDKEGYRLADFFRKRDRKTVDNEGLEDLLRDKNPLLGNMGRLGRETAAQLETMHAQVYGSYLLPASLVDEPCYSELLTGDELLLEAGKLTILQAIQADITLLRNPSDTGMVPFEEYDGSVQVHAAPKPSREVEIVYDRILEIIDRHKDDDNPVTPSDIFVMAPDISHYAPFISAVFQSEESKLEIHLMDHQTPSRHSIVQGFARLLDLSRGRWEATALLQLFEHPSFLNRHNFKPEDLRLVRRWVEEAGICWGKDEDHRGEIFKNTYEDAGGAAGHWSGTWEHGLGRLLEGLAMTEEGPVAGASPYYSPLDGVDGSKAELIGMVVHLIRKLQADLKILSDGTEKTLDEWSVYLRYLLEEYFSLTTADGAVDGVKALAGTIDSIGKASARLKHARYAFETVHQRLCDQLSQPSGGGKEANAHAVRFSSLQPMRAVPARVVILIGMDDGEFPRNGNETQLNLLKTHSESDYCPEQVDSDRYLFLEALLSARDYFLMTYVSQDPGMPITKSPSLLVGELLDYIGTAFRLDDGRDLKEACQFRHHLQPYNKHYFESGSPIKSYSKNNYQAAVALQQASGALDRPFLSFQPYPELPPSDIECSRTVDLKYLSSFAKNPLKEYFKGLGITVSERRRYTFDEDENLLVSSLSKSKVYLDGLETDADSLFARAEASGRLPQGSFSCVARNMLAREIDASRTKLASSGYTGGGFHSFELSERFLRPKFEDRTWQLPPLFIESSVLGKVKIVGRFERVTGAGVVFYGDADKKWEKWPLLAVFAAVVKVHGLPVAAAFQFCKNGKVESCDWPEDENPMVYLEHYLSYYFRGRTIPSPLASGVVKKLLSGDKESIRDYFKGILDNEFAPVYDAQLRWLWRNCPSKDSLDGPPESWQKLADSLFARCQAKGKQDNSTEDQ